MMMPFQQLETHSATAESRSCLAHATCDCVVHAKVHVHIRCCTAFTQISIQRIVPEALSTLRLTAAARVAA